MNSLHVIMCFLALLVKTLHFVVTAPEINVINSDYSGNKDFSKMMPTHWRQNKKYKRALANSTFNATSTKSGIKIHTNNLTVDHPNAKTETKTVTNTTSLPLLYKIHSTITRSKDAIWATISLTFMCVVLFIAVAQSRMWKDYHGTEVHGIPLPNFNERVPFKEVMEHKVRILKELFSKGKQKKKTEETELESLLVAEESE